MFNLDATANKATGAQAPYRHFVAVAVGVSVDGIDFESAAKNHFKVIDISEGH